MCTKNRADEGTFSTNEKLSLLSVARDRIRLVNYFCFDDDTCDMWPATCHVTRLLLTTNQKITVK